MPEPNFQEILKGKIEYYGRTEAAYQFAAEEYGRQLVSYRTTFRRLNITATVLDKLGFSEYWDEHGTWGSRTLSFSDGTRFRIIEQEEMGEDGGCWGSDDPYSTNHFYFAGWFAIPKTEAPHQDLFLLHEMYECIEKHYPHCLNEFVSKCCQVKMDFYIDAYLKSRS